MGEEQLTVPGPDATVTVLRDEWGIPHVRATTAHDAFFGQGFVHANDRLGQLEYDRRRAYGRWAEVAGGGAVAFDAFTRRCGLRAAARREYDALSAGARSVLDAYAAGVNAFLALGRPLPTDLALAGVEPERWQPWDCNAVFLVRHVVFANWQKKLWRGRVAHALGSDAAAVLERDDQPVPLIVPPGAVAPPFTLDPGGLGPVLDALTVLADADPDALAASPLDLREDDGGGSNAWVLAGSRTASGAPLLAGDPHRTVECPGVYVQNHLACAEFDAVGLAFVGVPGLPHFGHSARVAWAVTNAYGDSQDLYVERMAAGRAPDRVEEIAVRDEPSVSVECFETPNGPVVFGSPTTGVAVAMQSTALVTPSSGLEVLAPMLRATSVDELGTVMRAWVDPVNNFVCADVDGAITYHTVGRIPRRPAANAWGAVPGWDPKFAWAEDIPYDALPRVRDPEGGVVVTANQRIVGDDYPYRLSDGYARPDRATRVHARLAGLARATVSDMAAIHRDVVSLRAPLWVARLRALDPADDYERAALDLLDAWDGAVDARSGAAAVFELVRDAVCHRLVHAPALAGLRVPFAGEPPTAFVPPTVRLWPVVSAMLAADDTTVLAPGERWADVLAAALADGVALLRTRFGDDVGEWRWGAFHLSAPKHPLSAQHPEWQGTLDPPEVEMAGDWDTVFSAAHAAGSGFTVTSASVARYVFDLGDWDASRWIVPLGADGECTSPHFADQQAAWARGDLVPMRYDWAAIEASTTARTTLLVR